MTNTALAVMFLLKYTQNNGVGNHASLGEYFDNNVKPFTDKLVKNNACYQHLAFSGCGSISVAESQLKTILGQIYQGLFFKGFNKEEIKKREISIGMDKRFFYSVPK